MSLAGPNGYGYGHLTVSGIRVLRPPAEGGLFFVDMDLRPGGWDTVVAALRGLPPSVANDAAKLVFRSPHLRWAREAEPILDGWAGWPGSVGELATALFEAVRSHRLPHVEVGAFELPLAAAPTMSSMVDETTLARCRAVEIHTFLGEGNAIWRPRTYHYRLPSGHHAGSFVRIADAFRDPRAPAALATWLHPCMTEKSALVVDSGTLMPIVQQLDLAMRSAFLARRTPQNGLAGIEALDAYPRTRYEYLHRFRSLEGMEVLAVLSVSSTGRTYRMLRDTLQETAPEGGWRAECLVTRTEEPASGLPPPEARGRQAAWYSLGDDSPEWRVASECDLCRNPATARLVHVDPRSFAAMVLPDPERIMPDTITGLRNASLWNCYRERDAFSGKARGVQLVPGEMTPQRSSPLLRPSDVPQVHFEATLLLTPPLAGAADPISRQVEVIENPPACSGSPTLVSETLRSIRVGEPTIAVCGHIDLAVLGILLEDADMAREKMLHAARTVCPTVRSLIEVKALPDADLEDHTSVLLVVSGLRTGVTLQRMMVSVQDHYRERGDDPSVHGLVLHAHPPDRRAWRSLQNTFRGHDRRTRLLALWLTHLPEKSPLEEEYELLSRAEADWFETGSVLNLWERRREWLRHQGSLEPTLFKSPFWSPTSVELRRTSLYGSLDDRHTIVAVAAAMQSALERHTAEGRPQWIQFDLPNSLRSYFDGVIHAAIIRSVAPEHAWWGPDNSACVTLLSELEGRFEEDWRLLLPELLLAAAQGKVPHTGVRHLIDRAEGRLGSGTTQQWPREVLDYVDLGLTLVRKLVPHEHSEHSD
jgi:hypothetical protein